MPLALREVIPLLLGSLVLAHVLDLVMVLVQHHGGDGGSEEYTASEGEQLAGTEVKAEEDTSEERDARNKGKDLAEIEVAAQEDIAEQHDACNESVLAEIKAASGLPKRHATRMNRHRGD